MKLKPEPLQKADIAAMLNEIEFEIIKNGSYNRPKGSSLESRWLSTNINFDHEIDAQGNIWAITDNSAEIIYCVEVNHTYSQNRRIIRDGNQIIATNGEWEMEKDVGISIMLTMIRHNIPGQYLFLRSGSDQSPKVEALTKTARMAMVFWKDSENPGRPLALDPGYYWGEGSICHKFSIFARDHDYNKQAMYQSPILKSLRNLWTVVAVNPGCGYNAVHINLLQKMSTYIIQQNLINW